MIVEESVVYNIVPSAIGGKPRVTWKNRGPNRGPQQDYKNGDDRCHDHGDHSDHDEHDDHDNRSRQSQRPSSEFEAEAFPDADFVGLYGY